jgi:hypothetical protein
MSGRYSVSRKGAGGRPTKPKCCSYSFAKDKLCSKACRDPADAELLGTCGDYSCIQNVKKCMAEEAQHYVELLVQSKEDDTYLVLAAEYREDTIVAVVKTRQQAKVQKEKSRLAALSAKRLQREVAALEEAVDSQEAKAALEEADAAAKQRVAASKKAKASANVKLLQSSQAEEQLLLAGFSPRSNVLFDDSARGTLALPSPRPTRAAAADAAARLAAQTALPDEGDGDDDELYEEEEMQE